MSQPELRGAWGERFEYEGDKFDPCIEEPEDNDACPRCSAVAWTSWDDGSVTCDRCRYSEKVAPR